MIKGIVSKKLKNLYSIKFLISEDLVDSNISYDEFVLINNILK